MPQQDLGQGDSRSDKIEAHHSSEPKLSTTSVSQLKAYLSQVKNERAYKESLASHATQDYMTFDGLSQLNAQFEQNKEETIEILQIVASQDIQYECSGKLDFEVTPVIP